MTVTLEPTTKIVELNGVPARIWQGETSTGIKCHAYITRIAIDVNEPEENQEQFQKELLEQRPPSAALNAIPARMIL